MKSDLLKIINYYGVRHQLKKFAEEVYELQEAILESETFYNDSTGHIAEEIADVMVMLGQFQNYYDIDDNTVRRIMIEKVDRQIERIINENNR